MHSPQHRHSHEKCVGTHSGTGSARGVEHKEALNQSGNPKKVTTYTAYESPYARG